LSEHEAERLVATLDIAHTNAEKRDRAMFRTMLGLGLRVGSVVALDVEDLDLNSATLTVRTLKNSDRHIVFLPPDLVMLLRAYLGDRRTGPLFPRANGERIGVRQVARRLETWTGRADIERQVSPHALRHPFAMRMYAATGDVLLVSRLMLHRSLASTAIYSRPTEARMRGAMAAARA
jgi:integrase/recombinase XerC